MPHLTNIKSSSFKGIKSMLTINSNGNKVKRLFLFDNAQFSLLSFWIRQASYLIRYHTLYSIKSSKGHSSSHPVKKLISFQRTCQG